VTYSYTQISQYLACPRKYRYRYLDGWQEKDTRAAMIFGRVFEDALAAFFRGEDWAAALLRKWTAFRNADLDYKAGDSWQGMLEQGLFLLQRFTIERRVHIPGPPHNLQPKFVKQLSNQNKFCGLH
jgi:hypothetical protein